MEPIYSSQLPFVGPLLELCQDLNSSLHLAIDSILIIWKGYTVHGYFYTYTI